MPSKPVILAVDDDLLALDRIVDELERRYGRDYDVRGEGSADAALARIDACVTNEQPLALVLSDQWLREPHVTGENATPAPSARCWSTGVPGAMRRPSRRSSGRWPPA
jgi:hypothetical protein